VRGGAARLIVKTTAEAHRIPSIAENVAALRTAADAAELEYRRAAPAAPADTGIHAEARTLIDTVLALDADLGRALVQAFKRGLLDVPYCLHPDNSGRTRTHIDRDGRLRWAETGALPIPRSAAFGRAGQAGSAELISALNHVARKFDAAALAVSAP
jgi:methylaspartate mutase epsilon subunit